MDLHESQVRGTDLHPQWFHSDIFLANALLLLALSSFHSLKGLDRTCSLNLSIKCAKHLRPQGL
jgi:hypothetical protein